MYKQALNYLENAGRPVEATWARAQTGNGNSHDVIAALATYQNADGGFGNRLEVDIHAPDSQPFAARLAMQVMISIGTAADDPVLQRLAIWLEQTQDEDGCWRFSPGVYAHEVAPWFAAWTFPSLNPALCLAGLSKQLRIGSDRLYSRVSTLVDQMASRDEIKTGEFYELLPYVEYFPFVAHPYRDEYLDALANRITTSAQNRNYADADHFFGHVGPAGGEIANRLDPALIQSQLTRLRDEQEADGGWPSPYSPDWRPWITASAIATLTSYERYRA